MESSQSRHCNNSTAINANECGGGLENVNEQQNVSEGRGGRGNEGERRDIFVI